MHGSLYLTSTQQRTQTRPVTTSWEPACLQPGAQSPSWSLHNQSWLKRRDEVQSTQGAAEFWEALMPWRPPRDHWQTCGQPKLPCFPSRLCLVIAHDVSPFSMHYFTSMLFCASSPLIWGIAAASSVHPRGQCAPGNRFCPLTKLTYLSLVLKLSFIFNLRCSFRL